MRGRLRLVESARGHPFGHEVEALALGHLEAGPSRASPPADRPRTRSCGHGSSAPTTAAATQDRWACQGRTIHREPGHGTPPAPPPLPPPRSHARSTDRCRRDRSSRRRSDRGRPLSGTRTRRVRARTSPDPRSNLRGRWCHALPQEGPPPPVARRDTGSRGARARRRPVPGGSPRGRGSVRARGSPATKRLRLTCIDKSTSPMGTRRRNSSEWANASATPCRDSWPVASLRVYSAPPSASGSRSRITLKAIRTDCLGGR